MFLGFPFNIFRVKIGMEISGIYKIVNKTNGKMYVGSSKNILRRWKTHKSRLRSKIHHNVILQRAWVKYGESNFSFEILEKVAFEELFVREKEWIASLHPEYNLGSVGGGDNISSHPNLDSIRLKHSANLKYKWLNPKFRAKQLARLNGATNPNWKGGVSRPKCKECGKTLNYGHVYCSLCSKLGNRNPFYGKTHSTATKEKIRKANLGKLPPNTKRIVADNVEYESATEAARQIGVCVATILFRIKSPYWNYQYVNQIATSADKTGPL